MDDVEDAILSHPDPVVTTSDLADELPCSSRHVLDLLRLLERSGDVESKQVGARAVAWWHSRRVAPRISPTDDSPGQDAPQDTAARDDPHSAETPPDALADELADVDFPGNRERDECLNAVRQARAHLQAEGTATMQDFVRDVMPGAPAGYDVDAARAKIDSSDRYRGGWWRSVVRPGLDALGDVTAPDVGESDWTIQTPARE